MLRISSTCVSVLIIILLLSSCHMYKVYHYKYSDYVDADIESYKELMGKIIFYCPTSMIYERNTGSKLLTDEKQISDMKKQEVNTYYNYKDRIVIPAKTKGVYYDDEETLIFETEKLAGYKLTIRVDFGDSIIIPFSTTYDEYKSIPGDPLAVFSENSKGLSRLDRYNLKAWKNRPLTSEEKIKLPPEGTSEDSVEYRVNGYHYGYLSSRNWKPYHLKAKSVDKEVINEKRVKGKTKHNY